MLDVLGKSVYSSEFKQFKDFWLLDKKLANSYGGIKVMVSPAGTVDTILVAGHDLKLNGTDFMICSSPLPYGIGLNDDEKAISAKVETDGVMQRRETLFYSSPCSILLNNENGQIRWLKFFVSVNKNGGSFEQSIPVESGVIALKPVKGSEANVFEQAGSQQTINSTGSETNIGSATNGVTVNPKPLAVPFPEPVAGKNEELKHQLERSVFDEPYKPTAIKTESKPVAAKTTAPASIKEAPATKNDELRRNIENSVFTPPVAKTSTSTTTANSTVAVSSFKKSILDVFRSYRESNFSSIKQSQRSSGNLWNYKYTYNTKLNIPGEQFNMLYSFPFQTSQLDFVSILHESNSFDDSFKALYKQFEKKLMENFPASEGWTSSCIINKESSALSDLEIKNDKYGAIVLDYCKSPSGRHILYLRFLLYSN